MTIRDMNPFKPRSRERHEVVRLVRQIQARSLELEELRRVEEIDPELRAKERALEQLRWQLAVATNDLDAAA